MSDERHNGHAQLQILEEDMYGREGDGKRTVQNVHEKTVLWGQVSDVQKGVTSVKHIQIKRCL